VIRRQLGKNHPIYVFTFNGKPVKRFNHESWEEALKKVGLTDFRRHELQQLGG